MFVFFSCQPSTFWNVFKCQVTMTTKLILFSFCFVMHQRNNLNSQIIHIISERCVKAHRCAHPWLHCDLKRPEFAQSCEQLFLIWILQKSAAFSLELFVDFMTWTMSSEYQHACERALLFGQPMPSEEEWLQTYQPDETQPNENLEEETAVTEVNLRTFNWIQNVNNFLFSIFFGFCKI